MTTKEDFEKWYATKWKLDKECPSFDIWQACDELNKTRIAELLEIKMELECRIKEIRLEHSNELYKLELENKTLREALEKVVDNNYTARDILIALSTPTTQEHLDAYCKSRKEYL